jgi:hypothetical protein
MNPLSVTVATGIGDISWIYSKLVGLDRTINMTITDDPLYTRAISYVKTLPKISSVQYGPLENADERFTSAWNGTYEELKEKERTGERIVMVANNWINNGQRLEGYYPDLATDFHYEMATTEAQKAEAKNFLPNGKYMGIVTGSVGGNKIWEGWEPDQWIDFMHRVKKEFPEIVFVLIGAPYDMDYHDLLVPKLEGINYIDLVSKTPDMGVTIEVLRKLNYQIGFCNGLGMLANVLNKGVSLFYPKSLEKAMYSWPCPVSIETKDYQAFMWDSPYTVFTEIKFKLERFINAS